MPHMRLKLKQNKLSTIWDIMSSNSRRWLICTMMDGNWFIRMILKAKKIFDISMEP